MRRTVADLKEREAWSRAVIADDLSPNTKLIGWRLALYLNFRTGRCNPSYQTLAREVRITERSAIRAVRALEDAGWLVVERSGGGPYSKTNNFKLTMRMTGVTAASSLSGAAGVTAASNRGDSRRQKRVTAVSPEQRKEQRREQRREAFNCKRQTPLYHQKIEKALPSSGPCFRSGWARTQPERFLQLRSGAALHPMP